MQKPRDVLALSVAMTAAADGSNNGGTGRYLGSQQPLWALDREGVHDVLGLGSTLKLAHKSHKSLDSRSMTS